jgi:pantoate--beta-alanine ligase
MKVITTIKELQQVIQRTKKQQNTIGFVPTMGFLHEGHCALLKQARNENDIVVLSIFVNPLQFGPTEDLDRYPRDFDQDQKVAEKIGVDYLFHPSVSEMYPYEPSVTLTVNRRTDVLCGASRPGHFDGVATVLTKLFHIVQPDKVYFGKKDAQQVAVVHGLVTDFNFPLEIITVDTVREEDGLAKSSRNVYLTAQERVQAPILYQSLQKAVEMIHDGETDPNKLISSIEDMIKTETSGEIDYISILSYPQLEKADRITENDMIIAIAVKFSKARLIDNIILTRK